MADQSTYNTIKRRIEKSKRGTLFFPDTFADYGTSDAIRSALVRLCENEMLTRVAQGIYCYPRIDTRWGGGIILPSIEEIAEAIAKRDKVRIAPIGAYALYRLGLGTQIPANVVFITDGSPRRVTIGKGRGILFKHTSEMRTFAYQSSMMALIVTAIREIGEVCEITGVPYVTVLADLYPVDTVSDQVLFPSPVNLSVQVLILTLCLEVGVVPRDERVLLVPDHALVTVPERAVPLLYDTTWVHVPGSLK